MPACSCICFGSAESTGGRVTPEDVGCAGSDVERAGCFRIETGGGRDTEGLWEGTEAGGDVADDRVEAADEGRRSGVGADVIRGGRAVLATVSYEGEAVVGNLGDSGEEGVVLT